MSTAYVFTYCFILWWKFHLRHVIRRLILVLANGEKVFVIDNSPTGSCNHVNPVSSTFFSSKRSKRLALLRNNFESSSKLQFPYVDE
eukprot:14472129-Ditylum_brightwellii.AAC.1